MATPLRRRARLSSLLASLGLSVAVVTPLVVLPVGPAGASPARDTVEAQIAQTQQQLHALESQSEVVAERYNAARISLAKAQQRYLAASDRVTRAESQVAALKATVESFAAAAYRSHGLTELEAVTDSSPQTFLARANALDQIARSQQQALAEMASAHHQLEDAQSAADRALGAQQKITRRIESDRQQIRRNVSQQQSLLTTLRAKEAEIVRQERAAAAKAKREADRQAALQRAQEAAARAARYAAQRQAYGAAGTAFAGQSSADNGPSTGGSGGARTAVQWAYNELGKPYVWGAAGPDSFDCSGLTQYVWAKGGVYLSHYTGAQWNEGRHVSSPKPGDLVFFGSDLHHVGIWIGNNQFIHAPHTGDVVKISSLTGYYASNFAGFVRPGG